MDIERRISRRIAEFDIQKTKANTEMLTELCEAIQTIIGAKIVIYNNSDKSFYDLETIIALVDDN